MKAEILLISAFFSGLVFSQTPDIEAVFKPKEFKELVDWVFDSSDLKSTESFIISHKDKVIFDKYAIGDREKKYLLWSMSKSMTAMIFAKAEEEGLISRKDPIKKYFAEELKGVEDGDKKGEILLEHFLSMSSGLKWNEYYEEHPFGSHVVRMLYLEKDMVKYVLQRKLKYKPGEHFYYSSGDTMLLTGALKKVLGERYNNYPWEKFFDPMEMSVVFEQDPQGVFVGASYCYMRAQDLIKVGQLFINGGKYKGKEIFKPETLKSLVTVAEVFKHPQDCSDNRNLTYGGQIWLNQPCPGSGEKYYPHLEDSMILFLGHHGQSIHIFPEREIVIARSATDQKKKMDRQIYTQKIKAAFK